MNRTLLTRLAVSGFVIGVTMTGCSMSKMANAPSDYLGKPQTAAKSANDAREALEDGKVGKAVGLAEQTVSASPRDGGYRALLGQAYLDDGRSEEHTSELQSLMRIS